MRYLIFVLPILFFLSVNCERKTDFITGTIASESFLLGDTVAVGYKQTIYNEYENITLRFSSLVSDGRCPVDLRCFWEGNAKMEFLFDANGMKSKFSLNTYSGFTRDTTLSKYRISLINLTPYPHSEQTYIPAQYQAYVMVSKDERML